MPSRSTTILCFLHHRTICRINGHACTPHIWQWESNVIQSPPADIWYSFYKRSVCGLFIKASNKQIPCSNHFKSLQSGSTVSQPCRKFFQVSTFNLKVSQWSGTVYTIQFSAVINFKDLSSGRFESSLRFLLLTTVNSFSAGRFSTFSRWSYSSICKTVNAVEWTMTEGRQFRLGQHLITNFWSTGMSLAWSPDHDLKFNILSICMYSSAGKAICWYPLNSVPIMLNASHRVIVKSLSYGRPPRVEVYHT